MAVTRRQFLIGGAAAAAGLAGAARGLETATGRRALHVEELVPILDRRSGNAPRAVMGWSMGGYGALLAAADHPETFTAVAASSPAVWHRFADTPAGAFDDAADFERHTLFTDRRLRALTETRLRLDCGKDDPFRRVTLDLIEAVHPEAGGITPGFHDPEYWRSVTRAQLRHLAG